MRVLQVLNYSAPYRGNFIDSLEAIQKNNLTKIENFYLFDEETRTKSVSWIHTINKDNRHVFYLKKSFFNDIKLIKQIIRKYNIDVIHMHFWGIRMHTIISLAMLGTNAVLVRHFHNHSDYNVHILKRLYGNVFYRNATLIGCSESVANSIKRDFPKLDVRCVNNAISFERFAKYEVINKKNNNRISVMIFGADFERKGVDIAYKAARRLIEKGYKINLCIVCSINEQICKDKLKELIGTAVLPEWIQFLPPRQDIATYYRAVDVFISPSREEGLTYAIPEAAYCGCKVIASRIGGQLYHARIPGIMFIEPDDDLALSNAILQICGEKNDDGKIKEFIVKEYGLKKWVNAIVSIYSEKVLKGAK